MAAARTVHGRKAEGDPPVADPRRHERLEARAGTLVRRMIADEHRERERDERARVGRLDEPEDAGLPGRRRGGRGGAGAGPDLGPALARARGAVEVRQDLIPDDPSDPRSNAVVGRRARRTWAPDRLVGGSNPALAPHQHDAAARFRDDYELGELGASSGPDLSGVRAAGWEGVPYQQRRAEARQSYRAAVQALGPGFSSIVVWCVLQETPGPDVPATVEAWARSLRERGQPAWSTERAVGWLAGALEVLAQHYGFSKRDCPSAKAAEFSRRRSGGRSNGLA